MNDKASKRGFIYLKETYYLDEFLGSNKTGSSML